MSVFEAGGFCFAARSVSLAVGGCLPHCKSRRALSPCTMTLSTTTTSSAVVPTSIPRMTRPPMTPIHILLPKFANRDFVPPRLQSMWVVTQEYPASPVHSASQSPCLDLDAISSEDSVAKSDGAISVSPITVISVDSSNEDPDLSEDDSSTDSSSAPSSLLRPAPRAVWWCLLHTT